MSVEEGGDVLARPTADESRAGIHFRVFAPVSGRQRPSNSHNAAAALSLPFFPSEQTIYTFATQCPLLRPEWAEILDVRRLNELSVPNAIELLQKALWTVSARGVRLDEFMKQPPVDKSAPALSNFAWYLNMLLQISLSCQSGASSKRPRFWRVRALLDRPLRPPPPAENT